ncbi:MAG: ABC transporter permease [Planctomycetota bacterium]
MTRYGQVLRALGPLVGLVAVWVLFAVLAGSDFVALDNQRLMLVQTAVVGTAAVGATFVIASGGIDLSVGSTIALGTMVVALLLDAGAGPLVAALGGIAAGALVGLQVGCAVAGRPHVVAASLVFGVVSVLASEPLGIALALLVAAACGAIALVAGRRHLPQLELSPFIVTLGAWGALRGLAKGVGGNQPIYPDDRGLDGLMSSAESVLGLPLGVWILLAVAAFAAVLLGRTPFGRNVLAVGSNVRAARLCGVDVRRTLVLVYVFGIGCAGVAAVLQYSFITMGDPTTAGGYELAVIAAVVIGGASLSGGEGSIRGTLVGALIMTVVANGCVKVGLSNWVQEIVTGAIIVGAVALDRSRRASLER